MGFYILRAVYSQHCMFIDKKENYENAVKWNFAQTNVMTVSLLCIIMLRHVRTVNKNNQLHTILFTK